MTIQGQSRYHEVHARSLKDPEGFWAEAAREIDWIGPANKIFDPALGLYGRWFAGAVVNTCYNALDRQVARGRADQLALIHDSPLADTVTTFTYAELLREVQTLAAVMADFGVGKGDRVIIYMPMVPETMVAMLACARIGAVHSVVFGGFAAKELATRIDDAKPKLILSASCGIEPGRVVPYKPLLDEAIALASAKPEACIILQRPQADAPLLHGCTTILYEGKPVGTPDAGAFWRVIAEHGAVAMFTAPTAFRAIKKEDPQGKFFAKYDLSKFRALFLAGERADPDTVAWAENLLRKPVIDHWWQTETGWARSW